MLYSRIPLSASEKPDHATCTRCLTICGAPSMLLVLSRECARPATGGVASMVNPFDTHSALNPTLSVTRTMVTNCMPCTATSCGAIAALPASPTVTRLEAFVPSCTIATSYSAIPETASTKLCQLTRSAVVGAIQSRSKPTPS
eukprot:5060470-Prymnesium_polylepis.1